MVTLVPHLTTKVGLTYEIRLGSARDDETRTESRAMPVRIVGPASLFPRLP